MNRRSDWAYDERRDAGGRADSDRLGGRCRRRPARPEGGNRLRPRRGARLFPGMSKKRTERLS